MAKLRKLDIRLLGYPSRAIWVGDISQKSLFWEGMIERGHFCGAAFFLTASHNELHVTDFLTKAREVLKLIGDGDAKLRGQEPQPVFRRA